MITENIQIKAGNTYNKTFAIDGINDSIPIGQVRKEFDGPLVKEITCEVTGAQISIAFTADFGNGSFLYDIQVEKTNGDVETLIEGVINVL